MCGTRRGSEKSGEIWGNLEKSGEIRRGSCFIRFRFDFSWWMSNRSPPISFQLSTVVSDLLADFTTLDILFVNSEFVKLHVTFDDWSPCDPPIYCDRTPCDRCRYSSHSSVDKTRWTGMFRDGWRYSDAEGPPWWVLLHWIFLSYRYNQSVNAKYVCLSVYFDING